MSIPPDPRNDRKWHLPAWLVVGLLPIWFASVAWSQWGIGAGIGAFVGGVVVGVLHLMVPLRRDRNDEPTGPQQ